MLSIERVGRYYGTRPIFENLTWQIEPGEHSGLVGPNGAGKSTLLRLLAGIDRPDEGQIIARRGLKAAYLPQEVPAPVGSTPLSIALEARPDLSAISAAIEAAGQQMSQPAVYSDATRLMQVADEHAHLLEQYEELGGPRLDNEATALLRSLGFSDDELHEPLPTLSGGQKKLAHVARCILAHPDLLLLDEPDNHLDMAGKARLEAVIRNFPGAVIVISHDRYLLDETVTQIAELEDGKLLLFPGDYSAYAVQKELLLATQQANFADQQKEIAHLEEAVARFKDWASRTQDKEKLMRKARNTQRRLDRVERLDKPVLERRRMALALHPSQRGGQKVVELRGVSKSFAAEAGNVAVLRDLHGLVRHGERVGIIGPNGAGKSVLFRLIQGQLEPTAGSVWVGPSIALASYTQEHQSLDPERTLVETIRAQTAMYEGQAYAFLGKFLFGYEQASHKVATLSGGEKARLQLACLMLSGANCLLLDEPTNNLDILSAEVLERTLAAYAGTVIVISHDRYFLDRVADRLWLLDAGRLQQYEGGWSEYEAHRELTTA